MLTVVICQKSKVEFGELRAYLVSKLLWDPYMSEDEYQTHIKEFLTYYYGNGWEQIGAWIEALQKATEIEGLHYGLSIDPFNELVLEFLREHEQEYDLMWDTAEAMADDAKILRHIQKSRIQYDYLKLCRRYLTDYLGGNAEEKEKYLEEARQLLTWCIECGIRYKVDQDLSKAPTCWEIPGE